MLPNKRLYTLDDVHLYVITTEPREGQAYQEMVRAACAGGADVIQLREKKLSTRQLILLCRDLKKICEDTGTLLILNDRVDVASVADVDGVHVGQDDLSVRDARHFLGHRKIVGCSCHSVAQALQAQGDGADYVSCGPLFETPTKPDYKPVGLDLIKQYRAMVHLPFVAIGGINESNVDEVIATGADRVAVVRAICGAEDVEAAARGMKDKVLKSLKGRQESLSPQR